ncbi:MAG: hypothetical protein KatS3mg002_1102 [Candidatus Woesearchaeota archaeon]|nr:MAG: hypothetical protein KatS3mg002_1102 [Candidatus Woesearchaeota archaeon]
MNNNRNKNKKAKKSKEIKKNISNKKNSNAPISDKKVYKPKVDNSKKSDISLKTNRSNNKGHHTFSHDSNTGSNQYSSHHTIRHAIHQPSQHSLKEDIIKGSEKVMSDERKTEKKFEITDRKNYEYAVDDALRKLFFIDEKKKKVSIKEKSYLKKVLSQAGYEIDAELFKKRIFRYNILIVLLFSIFLIIYGLVNGLMDKVIFPILLSWIIFYPLLLLISWGLIFLFLDYKKYVRKKELEEVWPEYLQLVVSNINAGMLIDVALWSAVKPKYNVLAKEIEQVAKQTLTGKELSEALTEFAEKYDSVMVQRTISLLIEGMESGGKIATLLNKISLDIQDTKIMRKEMSASVTTYAIFISFATVVAAPFLFALSTQLLLIIQTIIGKVSQSSTTTSLISLSADAVKLSDFKIFAYTMLAITSFMSACLVGSIRRGSIKDGLKFIPLFVIGTILIYYVSSIILASFFSNII